jgi:hypothetical protein
MATNKKEIAGLMGEHQAIRAHMKFLINSLTSMAAPSSQIKDLLWSYRMGLYDFRDGIRLHIDLDERIFKALPGSTSVAATMKEHQEIQKQVDEAIHLADSSVNDKLAQAELKQYASQIREAFDRICALIEAHTATEDRLLKTVPKD